MKVSVTRMHRLQFHIEPYAATGLYLASEMIDVPFDRGFLKDVHICVWVCLKFWEHTTNSVIKQSHKEPAPKGGSH